MKIQALILAAALSCGAAIAAAPNDTANAPAATDAKPTTSKSMAGKHRKTASKHHAVRHSNHAVRHSNHAVRHATRKHHERMASSPTSVDSNDASRQSRMDDALATYRKQGG